MLYIKLFDTKNRGELSMGSCYAEQTRVTYVDVSKVSSADVDTMLDVFISIHVKNSHFFIKVDSTVQDLIIVF